MMHDVYLSLGSNIEPDTNLRACLKLLHRAFTVMDVSPVYETPPVGFTEQSHFLNAAVHVQTEDDPVAVKVKLLAMEQRLGRVRDPHSKNAPRTIDLDIALWDRVVLTYGEKPWRLPDPDILRFIHVTRPLADLAPEYVHPETGETLASIAARLDPAGIRRREAFDWD
jgi:2-amino-4-hydroxy-6-hydroxymethyldihydropteridine diphosphokinase